MKTDEETPQESAKSISWHILWLFIAALLVGYPLSIGPVAKYYRGRTLPPRAIAAFYAPLQTLYDRSPSVRHFFDWYVEKVWGVH